jgi:putative addiction module CopG family antidote
MASASSQPLTVQLSGPSAEFVRAQLAAGHHSSASEVIEDLIQTFGDALPLEHLDTALLRGLNSGPGIEVAPDYWEKKRQDFVDWYQRTLTK